MLSTTPRKLHVKKLREAVKAFADTKASIETLLALYGIQTAQSTAEEFRSLQEPRNCTHGYFCEACPGCAWDEVDEII